MQPPKKFEIIGHHIVEELHGHRLIVAEVPYYSERHKPLLASAPEMRDALQALLDALPTASEHPAIKAANELLRRVQP